MYHCKISLFGRDPSIASFRQKSRTDYVLRDSLRTLSGVRLVFVTKHQHRGATVMSLLDSLAKIREERESSWAERKRNTYDVGRVCWTFLEFCDVQTLSDQR